MLLRCGISSSVGHGVVRLPAACQPPRRVSVARLTQSFALRCRAQLHVLSGLVSGVASQASERFRGWLRRPLNEVGVQSIVDTVPRSVTVRLVLAGPYRSAQVASHMPSNHERSKNNQNHGDRNA